MVPTEYEVSHFEKLNSKLAFKLGQAIAKKFSPSEIIIGQDTRLSSNMLAYGVAYGSALAGVNLKIAGVMITASHNPYTDNGIKVIKSGYKMLDEEELNLETYIDDNEVLSSSKLGSIEITHDEKIFI